MNANAKTSSRQADVGAARARSDAPTLAERQSRPDSGAAATPRLATVGANPTATRKRRPRKPKITCEDCYFKRNLLCSLDAAEPCPTFRDHERGLKPPQQLSFVFRQERTRAAWVFEHRDS
ncbi:MAG: hypothetical protein HY827_04660 [Actinobacteria bacterium]|nr:hypothetical protein [Actinomycetota bacterium]